MKVLGEKIRLNKYAHLPEDVHHSFIVVNFYFFIVQSQQVSFQLRVKLCTGCCLDVVLQQQV